MLVETEEYMTVREAMDYLGVARSTLDGYVRQYGLSRYQSAAPKRTLYKRAAIEALKGRVNLKQPRKRKKRDR